MPVSEGITLLKAICCLQGTSGGFVFEPRCYQQAFGCLLLFPLSDLIALRNESHINIIPLSTQGRFSFFCSLPVSSASSAFELHYQMEFVFECRSCDKQSTSMTLISEKFPKTAVCSLKPWCSKLLHFFELIKIINKLQRKLDVIDDLALRCPGHVILKVLIWKTKHNQAGGIKKLWNLASSNVSLIFLPKGLKLQAPLTMKSKTDYWYGLFSAQNK